MAELGVLVGLLLAIGAGAVRLGKVVPQVWENLEKHGYSQEQIDEALEAAEEEKNKAAELAKEAISKAADIDWKSTADAAKEARELHEKYGIFKEVVMSAWFKRLMKWWSKLKAIKLLGQPRMSPAAVVILLYMLIKARQPFHVLVLVAAFLYNVHPLVVLALAVGFVYWGKLRKPKGYYGGVKILAGPPAEPLPMSEDASKPGVVPAEVDHIVIGSDLGSLYAAALLSRLGHTVVVLEPSEYVGACSLNFRGVEFDYGSHALGMVETYDGLLRSAMLPGVLPIKWLRIGTEDNGFAFDVATVGNLGDVVYRAGKQALIDDQVTTCPEQRDAITAFVTKSEGVAREQHHYFVTRLFQPSYASTLSVSAGATYGQAAARNTAQVASVLLPTLPEREYLRGVFRLEGLPLTELSFGAYVSMMNHVFDGLCYPAGGFKAIARALIPTIQAAGGRVYTGAKMKNLVVEDVNKMAVAKAVRLENNDTIRCRKSVISGLGVVHTYTQLLPKTVPLPDGLEYVREARPRFYLLVVLKGTPDELDLPASDYHYIPTETSGGEWMHISFPCAKDPSWSEHTPERCCCVIETEADDDVAEEMRREKGAAVGKAPGQGVADQKGMMYYKVKQPSEAKSKRMVQSQIRRLLELFPQLENRVEEQGLHGPFRAGLSHTPARFAAKGLRPATNVQGLFMTGKDLSLGTAAGAIQGGWLAAHAVLGYNGWDLMLLQRNLINDLQNLK